MKRLLTSEKYGCIRGSSSLSSITLFWSTMLSSLNVQITPTDVNLDFMNRTSMSKFDDTRFDQCKFTEIEFLLYLLGMLEL